MDCSISRLFELERFGRTLDYRFSNFNLKDINEVISGIESSAQYFKFHLDGVVSSDRYIENDVVKMHEVYNLIEVGATLVINKIENYSKLFQKIRFMFSHILGENVHVNGYLSKTGESPFGLHWDSHDVFAIQLFGKKHWDVYSRTISNPTEKNKCHNYKKLNNGELLFSESIFPGTVLYVPSGSFHSVKSIGELSFHITVGVHPLRAVDALFFAIEDGFHDFACLRAKLKCNSPNYILNGISEIDFSELTRSMLGVQQNIDFFCSFSSVSLTEQADFSGSLLYTKRRGEMLGMEDEDCKILFDYIFNHQFVLYDQLKIALDFLSDSVLKKCVKKLVKSGIVFILEI